MYAATSNQPKQKVTPLPDAELTKTWDQEKSYKALKKFNDPRFGDISVLKNNANNVIMVKEKLASSKNEATEDINYLRLRSELNHPNLLKLVAYTSVVNKDLCSTSYSTKGFYEFPRTDAYKELSDRQKTNAGFSHNEIAHLTYQGLAALSNVHAKGLAHGDIRPQLIGYDKQANHFQILDRLADPTPVERVQTNNIVNKKELYLAPQLYKKLKGKDKSVSYNAQKNDVFALGLTILYLGTGKSVQDIYLADGSIENRLLQEHVMEFDIAHNDNNPLVCSILKELLQSEESSRGDVKTVLKNNPSYDEYKRAEAKGVVLGQQQAKPRQVHAAPQQDYTAPTQDSSNNNFFDVDYNEAQNNNGNAHLGHNGHAQQNYNDNANSNGHNYNFPVEDNEDFGGYNPYMVKTNQVQHQPVQQQQQHTQQPQYQTQYTTQQTSHVNYNSDFGTHGTTTTYVRSTPHQTTHTYANYAQPNVTYVQSTPTYDTPHFAQSNVRYVHSNAQTLHATANPTVVYEETKQIRRSYQNVPVEVRRGSPIPTTTTEGKVIKKRYVMREDGTVVELDPHADIGAEEIRKYFDGGYSKDTIAKFDNVDQALNSDHQ